MRLTSWLESFAIQARNPNARRARLSVSARRSRPAVCRLAVPERLEDRTLLSASINPNATGVGTGTGGTGTGSGGSGGSGSGGGGSTSPTLVLNAGQNETTVVNQSAVLTGTSTYNDPSATQPLTTTWSVVSGPGTVAFENPHSLSTNALFSTTGAYVLQLAGTDGILSSSSTVGVTVVPPIANLPPVVSAGANQTTTVGASLTLSGKASDDNPQIPITIQWSQVSGPGIGTVTFGTPNSATTTAVFSQAGTYVLNLVATDGTLASNSMVTVTVNPSTVNPAPVVSAGPNLTVLQNAIVPLNGSASTSTGTLSTAWGVANAPGGTFFANPLAPQTTAQFSTPGIYEIRLVASNGSYTNTSYATITVNPSTSATSSFQQGVNGYTGTSDSYISVANPNANFGTSTTLNVRGGTLAEDALIEWNTSSISTSSTITSASITLDVTTAVSGVTYNLYALNSAWNPSQVTYTSSSTGTKWFSTGAGGSSSGSTPIGSFTASSTGLVTVTLNSTGVALVQSWVASPSTNFGIIIRAASGTAQLSLASSKNGTVANRPMLSVTTVVSTGTTYTPPPITNPTASANTAFYGFDGKRDGYMAPVGMTLDTLYFQYLQWQQNGSQGTFTTTNPLIHLNGNSVLVDVTSAFNVSALQSTLQGLGMQVTGVAGPVISGWMPMSQLANLAMTSGLNFAQESSYFVSNPADTTQGATAIGATAAQSQFGVNGAGITVGVLSDSYNSLNGAATDVTNGQLPGNVLDLQDTAGTDEGRAMTQIVYAEAPGASLAFATGGLGSASFAQNIEALQSQAGANVEVDDIGYFDQPFFQEGVIAQAADAVAAKGTSYFSAAGNDGSQAWQGTFTPGQAGIFPGSTLDAFGTGVDFQQVTIPVGSAVIFDFQWNQPFASVGGKGSQSQMDFFLFTGPSINSNIAAFGINNTIGGDAEQLTEFFNDGSFGTQTFYVALEHDSGPNPTVMKYIGATDGLPFQINTFATNSGTTFGQPTALGAAGVGAAEFTNTPAFGVSPPILESFSSTGAGTEFLFDTAGNPLPSPLVRQDPMFVGVDGVNLSVTGTSEFSPFFGTSAAAPSVAGVAALMLQEGGGAGTLSPSEIYSLLENTTIPMSSTPGFNSNDGFGLVNGDAAVQAVKSAPKNAVPTATLSVTNNPFSEAGGTTQVVATLSKPATGTVIIHLQFGGQATFGTQYTASSTQIVIAPGQTSGSITITGVDDHTSTQDETVIVSIFSIQNASIAGGSQSVTIFRAAADTPEITLAVGGGTGPAGNVFSEGGGTVEVAAFLTAPLTVPIIVNLGFSGSAVLGLNYSTSATSIVIPAGSLGGFATPPASFITLTGISNTVPDLPTASVFVTIESVLIDVAPFAPANVKQVAGGSTVVAEAVDNVVDSNPFGSNPVVSLPTGNAISISDNGGIAKITISQSTLAQDTTAIQLLFSGTAVNAANDALPPNSLGGPNYSVTDANGNPLGNGFGPTGNPLNDLVFIDRGTTSTTITVTGLNNFEINDTTTLIISLGQIFGDGAQASGNANSTTVTILSTNTQPAVKLAVSNPTFTLGGTTTVTASLAATTNVDVTVTLAFTGTATPNLDYTITEGADQQSPGTATDQIVIKHGDLFGTVVLTGINDSLNRTETTVTASIASIIGAVMAGAPSVTANYVNANVPVTFSIQDAVTTQGGVAAVQVFLSRSLPFQVSVQYQINDGTAVNGVTYSANPAGTLTFAPGVTEQTIFVNTTPLGINNNLLVPSINFTVSLYNASLDVDPSANPLNNGVTIAGNGEPTVFKAGVGQMVTATVSIVETDDVNVNTLATTEPAPAFPFAPPIAPPDIAAAVGTLTPMMGTTPAIDPFIVIMTNGQYTVYDETTGFLQTQTSLDQFWTNAGLAATSLTGDAINPRVIFDPFFQRFFAVAINPAGAANNNILFAVSKTQDPIGANAWSAVTLPVDPNAKVMTATAVALGMDVHGIYITADLVNTRTGATGETGFSIPAATFNNGGSGTANFTQYFNIPSGAELQPELNLTPSGQPENLFTGDSTSPNNLVSFLIAGAQNPNAAISPPSSIPLPNGTAPIADPSPARQEGIPTTISDGPAGFSANVDQVGTDLWAVETVADPTTGNSDLRWYEINTTTNKIIQTGLISDPSKSFYNASIAIANGGAGDQVVIGFTGSGKNEFASAYAVVGETSGGLTTFSTPILLAAGAGSYNVPVNGTNAWGAYSSTVVDPNFASAHAVFWTFQEFASAPNVWSVEMAQITVNIPQPTPQVSLTLSTPTHIGENLDDTVRVSAFLSAASTDDVEVTLNFGGSATLNQQYSASSQTIFIPAGSLSGFITLTGLPVNTFGTPTVTVSIAQSTLFNAIPGNVASQSVTTTIDDLDPIAAGNLSGEVYNDLNFAGTLQAGDPGIPNVLVYLDADASANGSFNVATDPFIYTTAAGASQGDYTFFGLANGSYNIFQVVPPQFAQTQPAPNGGYIGASPPTSGLNFGDAAETNPGTTLSVNIPQITGDGSSGKLTISLARGTAAPVSLTILVGGLAPFSDYTLTGPSGLVTLSPLSTFVATIAPGQTSVSYTIKTIADSTGTDETITFQVANIPNNPTNATVSGETQAETSIVTASGTPALVIDSTTQLSSTGLTPGFSFGAATNVFQAGDQPVFITSADLDGNGIPDLIVANSQSSSITVVLDPTSANPVTKTYSVGPNPTGIAVGDFNGDGALDLAVSTANGVSILQNSGYGLFSLVGSYAAGSAPSAIVAGDFNGDGKIDLAVANANSNNVSILSGNGNMTFKAAVNIAVGQNPTDIKAAPLANNGILDLVVANNGSASNSVTVLMNNGSGTFTATSYLAGVQPHSIAIADFTGNGDLDIAVSNVGNAPGKSGNINTVTVLFGNGAGHFTAVPLPIAGQPLPAGTYAAGPSVFGIAAGDVDGDGLPDLIVANNGVGDNSISVLTNNGNGTFAAPTSIPVGTGNMVESVVVGDFYGNGAVDIASANSFGTAGVNGVTIFKNADVPATLLFHVYLSHPATSTVTVNYATQNGTGTAFVDYTPVKGTLRFSPGTTVETIAVPILSGAANDQTVVLQLSGATNAPIQIGTGVGTINPPAPAASAATAQVVGGNLVVNDPTQNDMIQFVQLSSGTVEVLVNGEELGNPFTGVTGQVQLTTPNGLDTVFVDEEVTEAGTVTNSGITVNSSFGDFVFAELVNGQNWLLQA
ncbi:MAG TPA: FG-GAP-like repeat-containing protein [Planctomycetaceae bacterium]|nr:FG-GAP-like repeat-containing protein [Planctomycetaceae bacterium]